MIIDEMVRVRLLTQRDLQAFTGAACEPDVLWAIESVGLLAHRHLDSYEIECRWEGCGTGAQRRLALSLSSLYDLFVGVGLANAPCRILQTPMSEIPGFDLPQFPHAA